MTETLKESPVEYGADALIMCDNLVRIYQVENIEVQALQGLDLLVAKGEMIAIVGQSGSGKSTLLNVLSGLDVPTAGAARVAGWDLLRMSHADRLVYRRSVVGFVWQQTGRNLLPYLTARENVMLPMAFSGESGKRRAARANELLEAMGLSDKSGRRPGQLSGGEQQRVAIAVALANSPEVIFADEPTGELDSATGDDVFEALRAANRDLGATVVVVTHDHAVSSQVQRTVAIRDGRTATEVVRRTHVDEHGQTQTVHEEYAVLDRAGRLQLPRDYRTTLGLKDRVRLDLEVDHIGVWPDGVPRRPPAPPVEAPPVTPEPVPAIAVPPVPDVAPVPIPDPVPDMTDAPEAPASAAPAVTAALSPNAESVASAEPDEAPEPDPEAAAPVSPYLARPVVESPSKPSAPQRPYSAYAPPPAAETPPSAEAPPAEEPAAPAPAAPAPSAAFAPPSEPAPEPEPAPAPAPEATPAPDAAPASGQTPQPWGHRPSPYASLPPVLEGLEPEEPYVPRVLPEPLDDADDPYAPPADADPAAEPKEGSDD